MDIKELLEILEKYRIKFDKRKSMMKEGYTIIAFPHRQHDFYTTCKYMTDWAYKNNAKTYINEDYQYFMLSFENMYHTVQVKIVKTNLLGA